MTACHRKETGAAHSLNLRDRKDRALYVSILSFIALACIALIGQLRSFFYDVWDILWAVLSPLVISIIFTYVLRPVVDYLARKKVPRTVAILLIYLVTVVIIAVLFLNMMPILVAQTTAFVRQLPVYIAMFDSVLDHLSFVTRVLPNGMRVGLEKALLQVESGSLSWLTSVILGVKNLIGGLISAFVVPFLIFYLLKDYRLFTGLVVRLFRRKSQDTVERILLNIDESLGRYVRGQLLVMGLVGVATLVGLLVIHMQYALLLSLIVALTNIIPYVGPFLGAAPALFMAFGVSNTMLLKVLLVNLVVQQLEGNVFSPWIMGKTMNLHPLLILLAVMLAGEVGGITGLIFAVPIVAVIKVIVDEVHRESRDFRP